MSLTEFSQTYKPFKYPWAMDYADKHETIHWIQQELELQDDIAQWKTGILTPQHKSFITQILRLFTQTDVQVGQNYCDFFIPVFKNNEIRCMLLAYAAREGIHQRAYALLNETLGLPDDEFTAFLEFEEMARKAQFLSENESGSEQDIAKSLAKTVVGEGVLLFSAFIMLLAFKRKGMMMGMSTAVEWSIRDETEHVFGMSDLFIEYCRENPQVLTDEFKHSVYSMFREGIELEDKFIDLAYENGSPPDLHKEEVKQYIRYIADRRLLGIGFKPNWGIKENPLPWVEEILGNQLTNFFEKRVSDYSVGTLTGEWCYE